MPLNARLSFFSKEQCALLRDRVFQLLENNGVKMDHGKVLEKLAEAGARVDLGKKRVRFPSVLLEQVLQTAPRKVFHAGADSRHDFTVPSAEGSFFARPNTGAPFYLDPDSGRKRRVTIADIEKWAGLVDRLEGMDFCPFPSPSDVPTQTADIHALCCTLKNTRKHVWVQPYSAESVEYLIRLGASVSGGQARLRERPVISMITCSLTPLEFKYMDLEVMVQACPLGIPVHLCSLPSAGTTAPMTIQGTILLAATEILAMLAVSQVLNPGAPAVATPLVFAADMATGSSMQSSVEAIQGKAAAVEFMKAAFGIPTHTYGWGTDSPAVGGQSMMESTLLGATIAAVGGDILGAAGQLEVATAISPLQLLIDEEAVGIMKRMVRGLDVDDDTLAWEDLLSASPGTQFLTTTHTFEHCRDAHRTKLFTRESREDWEAKGKKDIVSRAEERYRALLAQGGEGAVSPELGGEFDRLVSDAVARLVR
ncbi:MAG: trimethylamine methyltransferase family protein [Deltaproteobacteria bacterium]|nr:trimethylamine methyltransferase family protein [Deltaproteobacteria bacterium]